MRRRIVAFLTFFVLGLVMMTWTQSGTGGGGQSNVGGGSSGGTPTTPGGSTTQIQYNNAGAFGGVSGLTFNSSNGQLVYVPPVAGGFFEVNSNGGGTNTVTVANGGSGHTIFKVDANTNNSITFGQVVGEGRIFTGAANGDMAGKLTCATSTVTKTFTTSYTGTPTVLVFDETTKGGANLTAISNAAFTVSCTGATDALDYIVIGNPN